MVLGKCEPGSAVKVKLGKSSSAKKWNGIYIGTIEEVETAVQSAAKQTVPVNKKAQKKRERVPLWSL